MACILLVDPGESAALAMNGILARAGHRCAVRRSVTEAWDFLRRNVRTDLVITELQIDGGGLHLVERLKSAAFLQALPVVVYTEHAERTAVQRALALGIQNLLLKPYHDDVIYTEIRKALANPWRAGLFEEERSFCAMLGLSHEEFQAHLRHLQSEVAAVRVELPGLARAGDAAAAIARIASLEQHAEAAGAWGVVEFANVLHGLADSSAWPALAAAAEDADVAERVIIQHLNPDLVPADFLSTEEQNAADETRERARWFDALAAGRCPVVPWHSVREAVEALPGCPVIDSVAASFQMAATGHPSSLRPLMDLAARDPGIAVQMLVAANHLKHTMPVEDAAVGDPTLAVGLLGEQRLAALARALVRAPERLMQVPPFFSWPNFWMFQVGVARVASFTCEYLGLHSLATTAYYAGLIHDLGKLLLLRLHPFALQAALDHVRRHGGTLRAVEQSLLGGTTRDLAVAFLEKQGLPPPYATVIRHLDEPAAAGDQAELTAVVSLARDLCLHSHVGLSGDTAKDHAPPIAETREWEVLRHSVFPSFNLRDFETRVRADCRALRLELHGRLQTDAVA